MNQTGSETFQTSVVNTEEYILLASTIVENGGTVEQATLEIAAIDDMLNMARMRTIINARRFTAKGRIRKDATLLDMMNGRLDVLAAELKAINQ